MRLPLKFAPGFALALLLATLATGLAQEVQSHGLVFEKWVRDTFFDGYVPPDYTQKWDIPAAANQAHGHLPVNPKATKYRTPVDLGDALRQFDINESFILVIGYWRQEGGTKRFLNLVAATITPEQWRKLWGPLTRADLEKLDAIIKNRSLDYREARQQAQALKKSPPYNQSVIVLNPKIDARGQRRLQCSLRFADVFKYLAPDADRGAQDRPLLWGVEFPAAVPSAPRQFAPKPAPALTGR
ncbi:MAG: hypothetical protein KA257_06325 [Opitutaceae bacterium]|nr:hypothetical protein [Opitutaceae bacterium]MBP9912413.1 hypothetical protein [Opitutaceae bacterium]